MRVMGRFRKSGGGRKPDRLMLSITTTRRMPKIDSLPTREAAFHVLSTYPYRDKMERIRHLRATFQGLELFPAVSFVEDFAAEGFPMAVEFISDSPKRRSPAFPKLAGFEFPDSLACGHYQKDLKAATSQLAAEMEGLNLQAGAADPACDGPASSLRAEMAKHLREWSNSL